MGATVVKLLRIDAALKPTIETIPSSRTYNLQGAPLAPRPYRLAKIFLKIFTQKILVFLIKYPENFPSFFSQDFLLKTRVEKELPFHQRYVVRVMN